MRVVLCIVDYTNATSMPRPHSHHIVKKSSDEIPHSLKRARNDRKITGRWKQKRLEEGGVLTIVAVMQRMQQMQQKDRPMQQKAVEQQSSRAVKQRSSEAVAGGSAALDLHATE